MRKKLTLAFALFLVSVSAPRSQEAGKADALIDRLDACRLDLIACVQGAVRAGTPLKAIGCRQSFQTCRRTAAAQNPAVVECRQECAKAWNVCRRDATPGYLKATKACLKRGQKHCAEARKGLDACIDGRQLCDTRCAAAGLLVEIP